MAAAFDPNEALRSTAGKANFQRVARLLISGGTCLLREIFDAKYPPSQLSTILSKPATKKLLKAAKLTKPQWDCLYPTPGVYGKSADFDISLLCRLLRTICNLTPPATGWDALPGSADYSLTADLARVKYYRNSVYGHVNQTMEVMDDAFPSLWQDISEALIRIAAYISPAKETEWRKAIDKLLKDPLTAKDKRNVQELERWYENDRVVKKCITDLKCSIREGMDDMEKSLEQKFKEARRFFEAKIEKQTQDIKNELEKRPHSINKLSSPDARRNMEASTPTTRDAEHGRQKAEIPRESKPSSAQKQEHDAAFARKGTFYVSASDAGECYNLPKFNTGHTKTQAQSTLSERMRLQSDMVESGNRTDALSIYEVPTIETTRNQGKNFVKKCLKDPLRGEHGCVGREPQEKILMVMGATGDGKSTLINGMINYIMGVKWEDKFRFKLIDESSASHADSVTKEITAYTIPPMEGSALPYSFTVIDTPGYGDTGGLRKDMFITSQIKEFFSLGPNTGIDHLDGIGFVTPSSIARLTPKQTYIFDAILSIFGKDMGNNIFMMVTFADGQHPPVLTAVNKANISYQKFFTFNNSVLFAPNATSAFDQFFWQMGKESFEEFFAHFQSTKSVKLELTNEVLDVRKRLEILEDPPNRQIKESLAKLEEMQHARMAPQGYESQMEHNKHFVYTIPTLKKTQIDLRGSGRYTTTCLKCNFTCHKYCKFADDVQKKECVASFDENGICQVCPGKCHWDVHMNVPYLIEFETVYETRTLEDLKKKYDMGKQGENKVEAMLKELQNMYRDLRIQVVTNMYDVQSCLRRLDEIALKPNPLTELAYIELLIGAEKNERNEGWMNRVRAYEEVKHKATIVAKIKGNEEIPMLVNEILPKQERFLKHECVIQ